MDFEEANNLLPEMLGNLYGQNHRPATSESWPDYPGGWVIEDDGVIAFLKVSRTKNPFFWLRVGAALEIPTSSDLAFCVACANKDLVAEECVTGATQHKVWAAMYGATVTVADPTPPTLSGPSGSLWSTTGAGHAGTQSATVSAQDTGGGVQSIVLDADGRSMASYGAPCNFTFAQPCPASTGAQALALPTTQLSDGTHTIALVATDAAGNQSSVSEQINVQNAPPSPPPGVAVTATQPGGPSGGGGGSPRATIHVSETLKGRRLVVNVKGHGSGKVRVSFTGRLHGRTVAAATRTIVFKGGKLTTTFKLGPRTAAHAGIRVSARLDHQPAVVAVLKRQETARR